MASVTVMGVTIAIIPAPADIIGLSCTALEFIIDDIELADEVLAERSAFVIPIILSFTLLSLRLKFRYSPMQSRESNIAIAANSVITQTLAPFSFSSSVKKRPLFIEIFITFDKSELPEIARHMDASLSLVAEPIL